MYNTEKKRVEARKRSIKKYQQTRKYKDYKKDYNKKRYEQIKKIQSSKRTPRENYEYYLYLAFNL